MSEEKTHNHPSRTGISRRQLLKALAATGGAVAASSLLPDEWSNPVVDVGTLPAHAQISDLPVTIVSCHMADNQGAPEIYPFSIVRLYSIIRTERPDIEEIPLVMTLEVIYDGTADRVQLTQHFGTATVLPSNDPNEATFEAPDYDLAPDELTADDTLIATWTFQNPEDSTDECSRTSIISQPN